MSDEYFMRLALDEAEIAYSGGQLPIGATLVINGKVRGVNSSSQIGKGTFFHHAENILIERKSGMIKRASKKGRNIELFTTMEPCFMCLGAIVHNRFTRVIYACPDPIAGSSHIEPPTEWYHERWPIIEQGPLVLESYEIFMKHLEENPEGWSKVIGRYRKLREELL